MTAERSFDALNVSNAGRRGAEAQSSGSRLAGDASLALAVDDLLRLFGAVQIAITLQDWRIAHHRYPDDGSAVKAPLEQYELQYQPTEDRQGYKLIGPRAWATADVTILERRPPAVRAE